MAETVIIAVISSGLLSVIVTEIFGLLKAKRSKKDGVEAKLTALKQEQDGIQAALKTAEKDALRTQLLVMISDYADEKQEILTLAEHYFRVLKGDWYMTAIFNRWLTQEKIASPQWFDATK